jgi:ApbE superfamily uncharacterized protein (UPF0280 family)
MCRPGLLGRVAGLVSDKPVQIRPSDDLDVIATGEEGMLSMQGTAILNHQFQLQRQILRNPKFDFEMWLFRTGRFRSN